MSWRPTASIATLEVRAAMLRATREYFAATRALEVETPAVSAATVTDVHIASVEATASGRRRFLQTSPEYAMKRLLAAYPRFAWLNPQPQDRWEFTPSIRIARELLDDRMFPLTLAGLDGAMRSLR